MAILKPSTFLVFAVAVNFARAHVAFLGGPNHLHPVHGLYVKPSSDGTTGDLYVAATEESAVKSQWLTDQPVNFLPHQVAFTSSHPDEAVIANQKRSIITSPAIKYTYAMPVATDGSAANAVPAAVQYPYAIPAATPAAATEGSESTEAAVSPALPYYQYPFHQYYYTQMMSAFANALNSAATATKENSGEEGTGTTTTAAAATQAPFWPYSYPVQYVMVDPSAWANAQAASAAQTTSTTEASTTAASNEIS